MSTAKPATRSRGHHGPGTKSNKSGHSSFRNFIAVPTELYESEDSKVYTVICIAFVGVTLVGLGAGLIIYALDVAIRDLVVIGAIGVLIGFVSLIVALKFLVTPIILRKQNRNRIAAMAEKQRHISVVQPRVSTNFNSYLTSNTSIGDVKLHSQPSSAELYDECDTNSKIADVERKTLTVAHPSNSNDPQTPTYKVNVAFRFDEPVEDSQSLTEV